MTAKTSSKTRGKRPCGRPNGDRNSMNEARLEGRQLIAKSRHHDLLNLCGTTVTFGLCAEATDHKEPASLPMPAPANQPLGANECYPHRCK